MTTTRITPEIFRKASGLWATGVSIVTTVDDLGNPFGLTMNAVTSLSLNPPQYLVNLDNGSDTLTALLASRVFCINVLSSEQQDLSNRFAKKGDDKFTGVDYTSRVSGSPNLAGSLMTIDCNVAAIHGGGDHQIVIGDVIDIITNDGRPLLYFGGRYAEVAD